MKKIVIAITACLSLSFLISCKEKKFAELRQINFDKVKKSVGAANYVIGEGEAKEMMTNFRSKYRLCDEQTGRACDPTNTIDSLSKSVWMDRVSMLNLFNQFLKDTTLDGLRFYVGAYKKISSTIPGQIYDNQISLIIVPTRYSISIDPVFSSHADDWKFFQKYLKDATEGKAQLLEGGFNHGELCPEKCPPEN